MLPHRYSRCRGGPKGGLEQWSGCICHGGCRANTGWLPDTVHVDARGFVVTGDDANGGSQFETSVAGLFAVGDVRPTSVKRVASAVGEGSDAISSVWSHVKS